MEAVDRVGQGASRPDMSHDHGDDADATRHIDPLQSSTARHPFRWRRPGPAAVPPIVHGFDAL